MTGMNDPRLDAIKSTRTDKHLNKLREIDITKEHRTATGHLVRGLQIKRRKQRQFIFGELKHTGQIEYCITGQVRIGVEWKNQVWSLHGEHDFNKDFNLVEFKPAPQPVQDLFANITPGTL